MGVTRQSGRGREGPWKGHGAGLYRVSWRASLRWPWALCLLTEGPWPSSKASRTQERAGWELGGMDRGQGQTVSPLAPAAHGVPAGLELQAYPGEKGTKRGLRGGTSFSITGWQDSCWLGSRPMVSRVVILINWSSPGQGLTFMPSGPLSPGGPMSPGNP